MKKLLEKILRIQTLKIILVNPAYFEEAAFSHFVKLWKRLPVFIVCYEGKEPLKIIDTGIPVKKKK